MFTSSQQEEFNTNQSLQIKQYLNSKDGNWLYFKNGLKIPIVEFFTKNKMSLGFQDDFGIRIEKEETDDIGMIHYLLRLTNKNVVIDDAWYTAHYSKDGDLLIFEGIYDGEIPKNTSRIISETDAIIIAKNAFTTNEIISLDYFQLLKEDISNATEENERVNCEMVYYKPKDQNYLLIYKVTLTATISVPMHQFYIDANNGEILKNEELIFKSNNTIVTKYNGERTIQTTYSDYRYYLTSTSRLTPIETRNSIFDLGWDNCYPHNFASLNSIYHNLPYWPYDAYNNAASAHWAVQESYNVFYNHFSRIYGTFTSSGGSIRVENNYFKRRRYYNGPIDNQSTFYAPGGSYDYIHAGNIYGSEGYDVGLDVIGHEFTHGCLYRSRSIDLNSGSEAGALMESLCDIFGEVIEYYTLGDNDYMFGTNDKSRYRRDFVNPESDSVFYSPELTESCSPTIASETFLCLAPAIWQGTNWYDTSDPNSNYINCSVQNRWFHLLAEGGTQNGVTVTGIGIEKAAYITYRNLAYYFNNTYTFASMRNASISNTQSYYGTCSNECHQVMNAWAAVGVGAQAPAPCISVAIGGPLQRYYGESGTWTAFANGGSGNYSYTWYVDGFPASDQSSLIFDFYPFELTVYTIGVSVTDGNLSDYYEIYVSVSPEEGMKSLENNQLKLEVYPNPAIDKATLQIIEDENNPILTKDESILVYLIDKNGRVLLNFKTKNRKIEINLANLIKGTYSIVTVVGKYKISSQLVINY